MLKKSIFILIAVMLFAFTINKVYVDGRYSGTSRAIYTSEPYYGNANITIEKGKIVKVEFYVRDSFKHVTFDDTYEKYFAGNTLYILQCRNDWKGIQTYPEKLLKCQDIDKVDAISGATWSYNIFKATVNEALTNAADIK